MDNIQKIRQARTLNEANVILDKLHATGAVRKLVEVSFMTRTSNDRSTQDYGMSCLNEAVTTLKDTEEPTPMESPGLKTKGDQFVKEEELDNHNNGQREKGSEQSSDNTPPYPQEGTMEGDEDIQNAPDTEDQMKEMENEVPYNILENTGLHPDIAKKMGNNMPKIPPMDSGDQMKQMQYTMKKYHETVIAPLIKHAKSQDAAIRKLSTQIRETKTMTLDLPTVKENSIASFRETTNMTNPMNPTPLMPNKGFELNEQRSRITQLNNALAETLT